MRLPSVVACTCFTLYLPLSAVASAPTTLVHGAVNKEVTQANIQQTICRAGWTKTVRPPASYTNALKRRQIEEFGLSGSTHDYEEDHLIPLELGGNPTSPANLWPEPANGPFNAHDKDHLERMVHRLVCAGKMSLAEGQREFVTNWVTYYGAQARSPSRPPAAYEAPQRMSAPSLPERYYRNCASARAAGVAPIYKGQPGYAAHLDRDGDGIACETGGGR